MVGSGFKLFKSGAPSIAILCVYDTPIAFYNTLGSLTMFENQEHDVRIEDYLDDKLQTAADLDNIDTLLENVVKQQHLLQQQVCKSDPMLTFPTDQCIARRGPGDTFKGHPGFRCTFGQS